MCSHLDGLLPFKFDGITERESTDRQTYWQTETQTDINLFLNKIYSLLQLEL